MSYDKTKYRLVPITPSREHLISIAIRMDHSFGLQSKEYQENAIRYAAQYYEECIGEGFYKLDTDESTQHIQDSFYNSFTGEK